MKKFNIKAFAERVRKIDDALGQASDHEGNEDGPTYSLWTNTTPEQWNNVCENRIEKHAAAIRLWRSALNKKQEPTNGK